MTLIRLDTIAGMRVVESELMTKAKTVDRTWRERLLSWPWRPWRATKIIQVPRDDFIVMTMPSPFFFVSRGSLRTPNTIVCHPQTAKKLRELAEQEKSKTLGDNLKDLDYDPDRRSQPRGFA